VAEPFSKVLFKVDDRVVAIERKAKQLEDKFKPYIEDLKTAKEKMKDFETGLKTEAAATRDLSEKFISVNTRLDNANVFVNSAVGIDGAGNKSPDVAAIQQKLVQLFATVDQGSDGAAEALARFNAIIAAIKKAIDKLAIDLDLIDFDILEVFSLDLDAVAEAFEFLAAPLRAVYDAAGAVLDALGSIFGWILKPLEYVLEAILKATGLQDLIERTLLETSRFPPRSDSLGLLRQGGAEWLDLPDV